MAVPLAEIIRLDCGGAMTRSFLFLPPAAEPSRQQIESFGDSFAPVQLQRLASLLHMAGAVGAQIATVFQHPTQWTVGSQREGLMNIMVIQKPATKAHKGINPFTKQEQMFKAKPARKVIKVRPLKALKDTAKQLAVSDLQL